MAHTESARRAAPVRLLRSGPRETVWLDDARLPGSGEGSYPELLKRQVSGEKEDKNVNHRIFRQLPARKRGLIAVLAAAVAASTSLAIAAGAGTAASAAPARATAAKAGNLGQTSGLLPRNKLTEESALQVNLSKETVRLPLYPGDRERQDRCGTSCWTPPTPGWRTTWA